VNTVIAISKNLTTTIPSSSASVITAASYLSTQGTSAPVVRPDVCMDPVVVGVSAGDAALRGRGITVDAARVRATGLEFADTTLLGARSWSPPS
jgi:hypothetical protein